MIMNHDGEKLQHGRTAHSWRRHGPASPCPSREGQRPTPRATATPPAAAAAALLRNESDLSHFLRHRKAYLVTISQVGTVLMSKRSQF